MTQSETELALDLGSETIHCSTEEVATALAGLLREMRAAAPFVTPEERETLRLIMSHPGGTLTVGDLFPDFERDSDALTALRRLRTAQFIRPAERDRWEAGERIEIKPFARLVWEKLGESAIFGDTPEEAEEPEGESEEVSEDIDLSLPGVDAPDNAETLRVVNKGAATWDEADVLDFLNDPKHDR
jgi:hypothetical protein